MIHKNHLDADETEHESEAGSQVNKTVHQTGEQEVERPQAENRANIRCINNERVTRDSEDRGDRIDRKDQVCDLDHDHG